MGKITQTISRRHKGAPFRPPSRSHCAGAAVTGAAPAGGTGATTGPAEREKTRRWWDVDGDTGEGRRADVWGRGGSVDAW